MILESRGSVQGLRLRMMGRVMGALAWQVRAVRITSGAGCVSWAVVFVVLLCSLGGYLSLG